MHHLLPAMFFFIAAVVPYCIGLYFTTDITTYFDAAVLFFIVVGTIGYIFRFRQKGRIICTKPYCLYHDWLIALGAGIISLSPIMNVSSLRIVLAVVGLAFVFIAVMRGPQQGWD